MYGIHEWQRIPDSRHQLMAAATGPSAAWMVDGGWWRSERAVDCRFGAFIRILLLLLLLRRGVSWCRQCERADYLGHRAHAAVWDSRVIRLSACPAGLRVWVGGWRWMAGGLEGRRGCVGGGGEGGTWGGVKRKFGDSKEGGRNGRGGCFYPILTSSWLLRNSHHHHHHHHA